MNDDLFKARVTKSNIKNHVFDIGDYPMCKEEADNVMKALDVYVNFLGFKSLLCGVKDDETTV